MDQHPIPRQITSFEFKLIGFLTLRQFIYIAIFSTIGVIFFYGIPIPIINIGATIISALIGLAFAFIPYNERPLDVFIINFIKKLILPTQYYYNKNNNKSPLLDARTYPASDEIINDHVKAKQKLAEYLNKKNNETSEKNNKKQKIQKIIIDEKKTLSSLKKSSPHSEQKKVDNNTLFLSGLVKNNKDVPIPDILIYIKSKNGQLIRILKTNSQGHFATFHPLAPGEYKGEIKDPKGVFFFDPTTFSISEHSLTPHLTISSKELL